MNTPAMWDRESGIRAVAGLALRWHRAFAVSLMLASPVFAQATRPAGPTRPTNPSNPTNPGAPSEVAVPPIECWWKTDRIAVRVGERFALVLTCAVLDTERVKVVVDESGLAPSALHLVPFDIVGGERFRDIQNPPRRFFQYQYTMRVLGEEFFGKEISLPRLQISYRVQNSLQGGSALQGRETQYSLVPVPVRVLSLVPAGAADIRDTPADTFGDVDVRLFRSNLLLILAGVAFVVAGLMAVMLLARAAVSRKATGAIRHRTLSSGAVLRAAAHELSAVQAASQSGGWSGDLAGRAAAALRLAGAVALARPVSQREVGRDVTVSEGQVMAGSGFGALRRRKTVLSASVTPDATALNGNQGSAAESWRTLSQTIRAFTAARYSRDAAVDGTSLDAALAEGQDALKRLRLTQWRRFGRSARHAETAAARQTWAR